MKKLTAVLMAFCMLFTSVAVFAEDDTESKAKDKMVADSAERELNWKDFSTDEDYENLVPKGDFTTFKKIGVKIWMPKMLKPADLSEEDKKAGYIGYFQLESNEDYAVGVTLTEMSTHCKNAAELLKLLGKVNGISNRKLVVVNGITGVSYDIKEKDTTVLAFLTEKGRCMEFAFSPASDEDFMRYILLICSSIQNADVKKKSEKSADSQAEKSDESGDTETESKDESAESSEGEDQDDTSRDEEEGDQEESGEDSEEDDEDGSPEDSEEGSEDESSEEGDEDESYDEAEG